MVNPDLQLARRAVACKHWRWMPGMLAKAVWSDARILRGQGDWPVLAAIDHGHDGFMLHHPRKAPCNLFPEANSAYPFLPDLTDPATLGCLLQLVRESLGVPDLYVAPVEYIGPGPAPAWRAWAVEGPDLHVHATSGKTEAEALVAALEATP